jgi:hypothetical protein
MVGHHLIITTVDQVVVVPEQWAEILPVMQVLQVVPGQNLAFRVQQ